LRGSGAIAESSPSHRAGHTGVRGSGAIAGCSGMYGPSLGGLPTGSSPHRKVGNPVLRGSLTGTVAQSHGGGAMRKGAQACVVHLPVPSHRLNITKGMITRVLPMEERRRGLSRGPLPSRRAVVAIFGEVGIVTPLLIVRIKRGSRVRTSMMYVIATMMAISGRPLPIHTTFNEHVRPAQDGVLCGASPLTPDVHLRPSTIQRTALTGATKQKGGVKCSLGVMIHSRVRNRRPRKECRATPPRGTPSVTQRTMTRAHRGYYNSLSSRRRTGRTCRADEKR
jgi:hypothetical protein